MRFGKKVLTFACMSLFILLIINVSAFSFNDLNPFSKWFNQNPRLTPAETPTSAETPASVQCPGNQIIMKISSENNAHGANASSNYPVSICYGDLSCRQTYTSCNDNEKLVVSLSNFTNAHISNNSFYGLKICCTSELGECGNGICEQTEGCLCEDCWGEQCPNGVCEVMAPHQCVPYRKPSIAIIKPPVVLNSDNWPRYKIGENIDFEQISRAVRDINVTWNFGNGTSLRLTKCLTGGNCNTTGRYTSQSHYIIKATATEIEYPDNYGQNKTDILVYQQGINVFSIITRPAYNENINGGLVEFNGSRSFVSNCSISQSQCTLSAGQRTCYSVGSQAPLYCYNLETPPQNYRFWFNWTIERVNPEPYQESIVGTWNGEGNYSRYVAFSRSVGRAGNYYVSLRVGYEGI